MGDAETVAKAGPMGAEGWRIRAGDYRVGYTVDDVKLRVSVTRVRHWSEVYEG